MPFIRQILSSSAGGMLLLALTRVSPAAVANWEPTSTGPRLTNRPGVALFSSSPALRFHIQISDQAMAQLRESPRQDVRVAVQQGATLYPDVSLHLKGRSGSFRSLDEKPGLTLRFDKYVPGQTLDGLTKIHLNNAVEDPTYLNEALGAAVFLGAGLAAPRVGHGLVQINERDLGLYVLTEGFSQEFLARYFRRTDGNLYEYLPAPPNARDRGRWRRELGSGADDRLDLKALTAAVEEPDLDVRWKRFRAILDTDSFLSFLALEVMLGHRDGYGLAGNNFRIYHDPEADRLVFLPHGMDQLFGRADLPLRPAMGGPVARSLLEIPQVRRQYWEQAEKLFVTQVRSGTMSQQVDQLAHRLAAGVTPTQARTLQTQTARLQERIAQRIDFLTRQFELGEPAPLRFTNGTARPGGWQPMDSQDRGRLDQTPAPDRSPAFHLQAGRTTSAAWKSTVLLTAGTYRFEARARTSGVVAPSFGRNKGAGIRVSGVLSPAPHQLTGSSDWTPLAVEFELTSPETQVDLVCQLRAVRGEAWFELESLKLVRVR